MSYRIKICNSENNFVKYLKFAGKTYMPTSRDEADQVARDLNSQHAPNRYYTVEPCGRPSGGAILL